MKRAAVLLLLAVLLPQPVVAETIVGVARVIDGDTIEIAEQRIRVWGIDAPEAAQRCKEDGALYPCGLDASHALTKKMRRKSVSCTRRDTDRYGRMVAVCQADGVDVSEWMVQQGQAVAFRKYSVDYVADEDRARMAKVGMWAGEFENPADFRRHIRQRPTGAQLKRKACLCPDDVDRAGRRCAGRSAYSRAGGAKPVCAGHKP
jgi:endonuclease YncB( thermonuclease family)